MLVKSLVAGTVLTLLAGGVVYYGTDVDGNISVKSAIEESTTAVSKTVDETKDEISKNHDAVAKDTSSSKDANTEDSHPHSKKIVTSENSSDIPSIKTTDNPLIDPQSAAIKETKSTDDKQVESEIIAELESDIANELEKDILSADDASKKVAEADEPSTEPDTKPEDSQKPTRKWIDQYLKAEAEPAQDTEATETEVQSKAQTPKSMKKMAMAETKKSMDGKFTDKNKTTSSKLNQIVDKELDRVLFNGAGIRKAEAKGFEDRAKDIENIWTKESESEAGSKTLHDVVKKHDDRNKDAQVKNVEIEVIKDDHGTTTIETETIDMGDGKVIKTVKKKHVSEAHDGKSNDSKSYGSGSKDSKSYGSGPSDHESDKKKIRIKVMTNDGFDGDEGLPEITNMKDGKKIKIRKKMRNDPRNTVQMDFHDSHKKSHKDISKTAELILEQAEKISMPELRDRAYLDLVSYALEHEDKAAAKLALSKIEQVELRDTARNRMAVAFAKAGKAKKAFAILDELEVDALRDVMRLQVIEALIVPENTQLEDVR